MTLRSRVLPLWWPLCAASALGIAQLLVASPAKADVSSWMFVGGGAGSVPGGHAGSQQTLGTLQLDAGFGSDPKRDWVFGGVGRTLTFFNAGTDLSLLLRTTTGGFSRGDWGLALDVGAYRRWWGPDQTGLQASLNLGGPWGLQFGVTGGVDRENQTVAFTLGFDWARGTAHRQSGQSWWPNYVLPLPDRD
jgi:hypothetical protein